MPDSTPWQDDMLDHLARAFPYPPTPNVASAVRTRIAQPAQQPAPRRGLALAAVAAALVLAVTGALAISRDTRDAIAEFFGIAVKGERISVAPEGSPSAGSSPVAIERYARAATLVEAAALTGIELAQPAGRELRAVYVLEPEGAPAMAILRYDGFDLWQFRASDVPTIEKTVLGGRIVEEVTVNGQPGYWIEGGERLVTVLDAAGTPVTGTERTVLAPTLLWNDGDRYLRIEGVTDRAEALALAESIR